MTATNTKLTLKQIKEDYEFDPFNYSECSQKVFVSRDGKNYMIKRYQVSPCNWIAYTVYQQTDVNAASVCKFTTITSENEVWYGRLGTADFDCDLRVGDERSKLFKEHQEKQYNLAYSLIREFFPETQVYGKEDSGEIEIWFVNDLELASV